MSVLSYWCCAWLMTLICATHLRICWPDVQIHHSLWWVHLGCSNISNESCMGLMPGERLDCTFREKRYIGEHVHSLMKLFVIFLDGLVLIFIGTVSWQNGVLVIPLHRCRSGKQVNYMWSEYSRFYLQLLMQSFFHNMSSITPLYLYTAYNKLHSPYYACNIAHTSIVAS